MNAYKITISSRGILLPPRFNYTIVEFNIRRACQKAIKIANAESKEQKRVVAAEELGVISS